MSNGIAGVSDKDRWKNRRKMAWIAIISGIAYPVETIWFDPAIVASMTAPYYLFLGTILAAYFGFATMDDKWTSK